MNKKSSITSFSWRSNYQVNKRMVILFNCFVFFCNPTIQSQTVFKYIFGSNIDANNFISVHKTDSFTQKKGYGFEYTSNLRESNNHTKNGIGFISSDQSFYFSVVLPEGNYNVHVLLGDQQGDSHTTIRAECRRLMIKELATKFGEFKKVSFSVHIKDSVIKTSGKSVRLKPREINYLHWDNKLTLEFNNSNPKLASIEIEKAANIPTIFLAGNSTVVDQPEEPWASWGQMIPVFFKPSKAVVANYAESGETLLAFKNERRLDKIWSMAKPNDFLLIEFAHNDQKPGANHLDPFTTYQQTLREWIAEARKRGMFPILVTSTNRRTFDSTTGKIYNSLGDYPEAMRQLAKEVAVPLIDLNQMSKQLYEALGVTESTKAFVYFKANEYPNQPKDVQDNTHFNTYGAFELAKCVAASIKTSIPALAHLLVSDFKGFDPSKPDDPGQWSLPKGRIVSSLKPDGN